MSPFAPAEPQPPAPTQPSSSSGCRIACLGCGVLLLIGAACVAAFVFFVFQLIKSNDAYRLARDKATTDPRVIAVLGAPIEPSFWVTGHVNTKNGAANAQIVFGIKGPRGHGTVTVDASRGAGESWTYHRLDVHPDRGPDIDLLR